MARRAPGERPQVGSGPRGGEGGARRAACAGRGAAWGQTALRILAGRPFGPWRRTSSPEEAPCNPNGAFLDVIVAAATIFFLCFCVKFVLPRPSVVTTGRCGQEGKQAQGDGGLVLHVAFVSFKQVGPCSDPLAG